MSLTDMKGLIQVFGEVASEGMSRTDAHLFGRKTYEIMAGYWPTASKETGPIW